jgi:uncharacterized protein YciI
VARAHRRALTDLPKDTAVHRYLVLLLRRPDFDPAVVPQHMQFLEELRNQGRNEMSGPFGDQSGGAYLLRADDLAEAQAIVARDPAHASGGWDVTVHEWCAH